MLLPLLLRLLLLLLLPLGFVGEGVEDGGPRIAVSERSDRLEEGGVWRRGGGVRWLWMDGWIDE